MFRQGFKVKIDIVYIAKRQKDLLILNHEKVKMVVYINTNTFFLVSYPIQQKLTF
jgi:hypothetical protein